MANVAVSEPAAPAERIDARTGKPIDELTDADMPPLESLGPDSDFSAFWSSKVSDALRQAALRKLFHAPQFNKICLCAEYSDDYTNFTPLGDVVPHDLKRALAREAQQLLDAQQAEVADAAPADDRAPIDVNDTTEAPDADGIGRDEATAGQGDRSI